MTLKTLTPKSAPNVHETASEFLSYPSPADVADPVHEVPADVADPVYQVPAATAPQDLATLSDPVARSCVHASYVYVALPAHLPDFAGPSALPLVSSPDLASSPT